LRIFLARKLAAKPSKTQNPRSFDRGF